MKQVKNVLAQLEEQFAGQLEYLQAAGEIAKYAEPLLKDNLQ
ncbi:MAG: hypothetical protein ACFHVJ_05580 [Aestuariibacter sp.]